MKHVCACTKLLCGGFINFTIILPFLLHDRVMPNMGNQVGSVMGSGKAAETAPASAQSAAAELSRNQSSGPASNPSASTERTQQDLHQTRALLSRQGWTSADSGRHAPNSKPR